MWLWVCVAQVLSLSAALRYGFYRSAADDGVWTDAHLNTRRVFGGEAIELNVFPAVCALLDRYWSTRCSCAVVSERWALTAAHCVSPRIAYIKYNAHRPSAIDGDVAPAHYLYRHPGYKVLQDDEGRGVDVTLLHHDVGLVRTRVDMKLRSKPPSDPLQAIRLYNPVTLKNEEVQVLGYGRTDRSMLGEELFGVRLQLVFCERGSWFHCMCGVAAGRDPRGVCSGDSGGPVIYKGAQVGVTSMGPMECSPLSPGAGAGGLLGHGKNASDVRLPPEGATSVFTSLYNYAELINATIHDTEQELSMRMIAAAPRHFAASLLYIFVLWPLLMPARCEFVVLIRLL